jgi:hypothetical protein
MTGAEPARKKRADTWPALAIALIVGVVWVGFIARTNAAAIIGGEGDGMGLGYGLGVLVGSTMIPVVLIWLVLFFAWVRPRQPQRAAPYLLILAIVLTVTNVAATTVMKGAMQRDLSEGRQITSDLVATARSVADGGSAVDRQPKSKGGLREVEGVARGLLADAVADREAYRNELAGLGFPEVITPQRVAADPGQRATLAKLDQMREIVAKYQRRDAERLEAARAKVAALPRNAFTSGFLEGYDKARAQGGATSARAWRLELEMVDEHRKAIEALRRSAGRWQAQKDGYVFERQADLDAWQAPIQRIQALAAEQEQLSKSALESMERKAAR